MTHPLSTVAGLKRYLVDGTTLRLENHIRPHASRTTFVLPRTNTVDLVTWAEQAPQGSHMRWPKAADIRPGNTNRQVHIDSDGQPFVTLTVIEEVVPIPEEV